MSGALAPTFSLDPNFEFIGTNSDLTGSGPITFTAEPIGRAQSNRKVIVIVANTSDNTITSATIGGVSATVHAHSNAGASQASINLISATVPTGTTADIVLNFSGAFFGVIRIHVYAEYGGRSFVTAVTDNTGPTADLNINVTRGSLTIAGTHSRPSGAYSSSLGFTTVGSSSSEVTSLYDVPIYEAASPKTYQVSFTGTVTELAAVCGQWA